MAAFVDFSSLGTVHLEPVYQTPRDSNCVVCSSVFIFVDFAYCLMMGSYLDITEILSVLQSDVFGLLTGEKKNGQ